jgi:hypothetical protein
LGWSATGICSSTWWLPASGGVDVVTKPQS